MDDAEKIKNTLKNAKNIGFFLEDNPQPDILGAVLAMFFALKNIGKKAFLVNPTPLPLLNSLIQKMTKEKLLLSFSGEVSEIFYEKNGQGARVYLTPKNNPILPNSFSCQVSATKEDLMESEEMSFDLLITFGISEYDAVENSLADRLDQIYQCDILNLDNHLGNQNYGDINFIKDDYCLSLTIARLINELGDEFVSKKSADALIFGMLNTPKNSRNNHNLEIFRWLLKKQGRFDLLLNKNEPEKSAQIKILEQALLNLEPDVLKRANIGLSFIEEKIFTSAGARLKDLLFTVEMAKNFFHLPSFVLLWNLSGKVNGVFWSSDTALIKKFQNAFPGQYKETGGLFAVRNSDLEQAKEQILALLP